ncbi:MAG TPA: catalase, partial [Chloroflexota bacterium]|nr:catalase [Chloroflexota bacterium]
SHTDDSLKAGERGPTLLEDFHFREKITHFDHERIPERVVHARGAGAYGSFQVYEPMTEYSRARFLANPAVKTPVFVRFSTVAGSRGSADTARDARGFATKFYTEEGVFDLVGNNIPIFFIQDAVKFPDLVHAFKPEPRNEIPQAATAHDTAWDFFSLLPEATHMVMWIMSDRAIPRSFRMMEGFGIHTFRFINARGISRFVKFHWKPVLGVHSLVWEEAQQLAGKDPDWHRRDLWEAIEQGQYPQWEFGVQMIEEADEFKFPFDILDATKIWPEELIPVRRIGKLTLDRNPDNFFAETEQVAFHPGHVVPGIYFTNDPLLQGRLFSYLDTQIMRLGGPNFAELPINRPLAPVHNNQRDSFHRQTISQGPASYSPNSLSGGCPMLAPESAGGYVPYPAPVEGNRKRARAEGFRDYFSQATLFWQSLSAPEQQHLVDAARFELGKVESKAVRERMLGLFAHVNPDLARRVSAGIGVAVPADNPRPGNLPPSGKPIVDRSPALSMANTVKDTIASRRVAILAGSGINLAEIQAVRSALEAAGARAEVVAPVLGPIVGTGGDRVEADKAISTVGSVMYDAVLVPCGPPSEAAPMKQEEMRRFIAEAYWHGKTIGATGAGIEWLRQIGIAGGAADVGVITTQGMGDLSAFSERFIAAIAQHRHWERLSPKQE